MSGSRRLAAAVALVATMGMVGSACGSSAGDDAPPAGSAAGTVAPGPTASGSMTDHGGGTTEPGDGTTTAVPAAVTLRSTLRTLLVEHVVLASAATGAALDGRTAEFEAAGAQLADNGTRLAVAIGDVYGAEAGEAFGALWETHIGFFVDYTTARAAGDAAAATAAAATAAAADLDAYAGDFADFLERANPALPADVVADLFRTHVATVLAIIDAQAAGDAPAAAAALGEATRHMGMIADPLAAAIAAQHPERFPGASDSASADLLVGLDALLAEHVAFAALATDAALGGRTAEYEAMGALLDTNTVALADAVGSVYGPEARESFLVSWRRHIQLFVDYTTATAAGDEEGRATAVEALGAYAEELAAFLGGATGLPEDVLAELVATHATTLLAVIDAQAADAWTDATSGLTDAMGHMRAIAEPLALAIVATNPDRFG